jgi:hypothetical protein
VENQYVCSYLAFVLLIRLTIEIRIGNGTARSSAVFIRDTAQAKRQIKAACGAVDMGNKRPIIRKAK